MEWGNYGGDKELAFKAVTAQHERAAVEALDKQVNIIQAKLAALKDQSPGHPKVQRRDADAFYRLQLQG